MSTINNFRINKLDDAIRAIIKVRTNYKKKIGVSLEQIILEVKNIISEFSPTDDNITERLLYYCNHNLILPDPVSRGEMSEKYICEFGRGSIMLINNKYYWKPIST